MWATNRFKLVEPYACVSTDNVWSCVVLTLLTAKSQQPMAICCSPLAMNSKETKRTNIIIVYQIELFELRMLHMQECRLQKKERRRRRRRRKTTQPKNDDLSSAQLCATKCKWIHYSYEPSICNLQITLSERKFCLHRWQLLTLSLSRYGVVVPSGPIVACKSSDYHDNEIKIRNTMKHVPSKNIRWARNAVAATWLLMFTQRGSIKMMIIIIWKLFVECGVWEEAVEHI